MPTPTPTPSSSHSSPARTGAGATSTRGLPSAAVLGLLVAPGLTRDLAKKLADDLRERLNERFPDTSWEVDVVEEPLAGAPDRGLDLVKVTRERMTDSGWDLAVCLTDLPLHVGRRPVTAHASVSLAVGVVSVPALGPTSAEENVRDAVLRLVERIVHGDRSAGEASFPVGRAQPKEGGVRFVIPTFRGTLRLIVGMVWANRPWRLIAGLSRAAAAALGTGAVALASTGVWHLADGAGPVRLIGLLLLSVVLTCLSLIVVHDLWERTPRGGSRGRVVLINAATAMTIALGVLTLYLGLFLTTAAAGGALIPPKVLSGELGHGAGLKEYLKLAWLVSSLATVGGGLGAAVENERAVREAAYGYRPDDDEETGAGG
jgi:hypothetical protein